MTSIDFFTRSESRIVSVDRLSDFFPNKEAKLSVLFDDFIKLDNDGAVNVRDFASKLPDQDAYDIHYTTRRLDLDAFDDYAYYWG